MQLFIRRMGSGVVNVEVEGSSKMSDLKALIEANYGIRRETIRFVLSGSIVTDEDTVDSLGLMRESALIMLVSKPDAPWSTTAAPVAARPAPEGPLPSHGAVTPIHFKTMAGASITIECGQQEPFAHIKPRLAHVLGPEYSPADVRVLHAGAAVDDSDTPQGVGVSGATCLHVVARKPPSVPTPAPVDYGVRTPINFKSTSGSMYTVECGASEPFSIIKSKLAAAMGPGYFATTMRILQAGELIEDDTTPSALSLAGSTCLHVVARVAK